MGNVQWSQWVPDSVAARRAGGRARYNALRRDQRIIRRHRVEELLYRYGWEHGVQARIARELGVSESTISKDFKALFPATATCPVCDSRWPWERWEEMERKGRVTLMS